MDLEVLEAYAEMKMALARKDKEIKGLIKDLAEVAYKLEESYSKEEVKSFFDVYDTIEVPAVYVKDERKDEILDLFKEEKQDERIKS